MATLTANILVGTTHPNHGGINPTHYVFLSENSKPAWILVPENISSPKTFKDQRVIWVPTSENMLEDALLMIAIHVIKHKEVCDLSKKYFVNNNKEIVKMYEDINQENLEELYRKCRCIDNSYKIVISILEGSTLQEQIKLIENYKMDIEVCTSQYSRLYSMWSRETKIKGVLD